MRNVLDKLRRALGQAPAELVLKNAQLVNVIAGEVHPADVAITDGRIIGIGNYDAEEVIDLKGAYVAPSFIDGHIHIESSMLTVTEFARAVVPHGTGAVIADPHELANVLGMEGIRYVLEERERCPIDIFVMLPSCVPATDLETSGAKLSAYNLHLMIGEPRVVGIGEMMNYPGVLAGQEEILHKLDVGLEKRIDGHAPGLTGKALSAYVLAGPRSDHESTSVEEAREKLRLGMHVHLRQGSSEQNLRDLLPLVSARNAANFSFVSDDRNPLTLTREGHIDNHVRIAIEAGIDPVTAIQIATINTARFYQLRNVGAVLPRYWADLVVFDDLRRPEPRLVFKKGALVARDGVALFDPHDVEHSYIRGTMNVGRISLDAFAVPAQGKEIRIIEVVPGQIVTRHSTDAATLVDGRVVADPARDIAKAAVIERHRATGNVGLGFVRGFGLKTGAVASSVGHDSHNICALGMSDAEMLRAVERVIELGGGQVVVRGTEVLAELALPVAGLISDLPLDPVVKAVSALNAALASLGCVLPDALAAMSFLPLVPIPELRLTDRGSGR
jgi:adenine deaminase